MKSILKSFSLSLAGLALMVGLVAVSTTGCPVTPTNTNDVTNTTNAVDIDAYDPNDKSIAVVGQRTADSVKVVVKVKASSTLSYYGVYGSFKPSANSNGNFEYDASWGGGCAVSNTVGNVDVNGFLTFVLYVDIDAVNEYKFQPRGYTVLGTHADDTWYGDDSLFKFTANTASKDALIVANTPSVSTVAITLSVAMDLSGAPAGIVWDYNANGTANEIGDFIMGGTPVDVFGDHPGANLDPASTTVNFTNSVAYAKGVTMFTATIPEGTSRGLDISIYGTNENIESGFETAKTGFKCSLKNQAADSITVVVSTNDGGFGKLAASVTGDVDADSITLTDSGVTGGIYGGVTFDAASYVAITANASVVITLDDADLTAETVTVSANGTDVVLAKSGTGTYTNTITVGKTGATVNATTNFTLTVSYSDASPVATATATAAVSVLAPEDTIDGLVSDGYTDLGASKNATFSSIAVDSDGTKLYVAFTYAAAPSESDDIFLLVDVVGKTGGVTDLSTDLTGWGWTVAANTASVDFDWIKWGNGIRGTDCFQYGAEQVLNAGAKQDVADTSVVATFAIAGNTVEVGIPYVNLGVGGAAASAVVNVYFFQKGVDVFPSGASLTDIAVKSADYTLE